MKHTLYLIIGSLLLFTSCLNEDDIFEGAAISFYPTVIEKGSEEDGNTYILALSTSGYIEGSGKAIISVDLSAEGILTTIPPIVNNKIEVEINDNDEAVILVTVENDAIPDDYSAIFKIVSVSGEIAGIGRDKFTLFVEDRDVAPIYAETFNTCNNLNTFTPFSVSGTQSWACTGFGLMSDGARMNGFSGGAQLNEDWLISEGIDLLGLGTASVRFVSDVNFSGPALEFKVSTDYSGSGDPTGSTWTTLNAIYDTQAGNDTWTSSGNIDISSYLTGATYFAFVYKSSPSDGAAQWTIDDFEISIFHPNASGGGNDNLAQLPFEDDFEDCSTDFGTPDNFTVHYISGTKDDRGWGCRATGLGDSRGVRVNVFGGEVGTSDTWLITKNKYDLRNLSSATVNFDIRSAAGGDGTFKVLYSTNYFGEGPALGTWTELDFLGQLPAKGSNTFTNVSADIPGGSVVYVAFRFSGATNISSASYDIDNFSLTPFQFGSLPFVEGFDNCVSAGTFNIPENWIEVNVPGSKTDRGWGCNAGGRSGSGIRASAFGGAAGTDNAWLISEGKFNLSGLSTATLKFWVENRFTGPGQLQVKWSADYPGSGNPLDYTWTTLGDVAAQLPAANSTTYKEITSSMNAAVGQSVHLAFHYFDGTNAASVAFTIDDIQLTGN